MRFCDRIADGFELSLRSDRCFMCFDWSWIEVLPVFAELFHVL
jgi:predicted adenine nucleotide alpha hydrolase (AANH) superfamily ATPase